MAADMHLHSVRVIPSKSRYGDVPSDVEINKSDITEEDLKCFRSHTLGSRFFDLMGECREAPFCTHWNRIERTDQVNLGEISFLKAALFDDPLYAPVGLTLICDIVGEDLPVLTEQMINMIISALGVSDPTSHYGSISPYDDDLRQFLRRNEGVSVFTVTW